MNCNSLLPVLQEKLSSQVKMELEPQHLLFKMLFNTAKVQNTFIILTLILANLYLLNNLTHVLTKLEPGPLGGGQPACKGVLSGNVMHVHVIKPEVFVW